MSRFIALTQKYANYEELADRQIDLKTYRETNSLLLNKKNHLPTLLELLKLTHLRGSVDGLLIFGRMLASNALLSFC